MFTNVQPYVLSDTKVRWDLSISDFEKALIYHFVQSEDQYGFVYNVVEEMLGVSSRKSNGLREKSRSVRQRVRQRPDSAITTNFESNGHGKLRRHKSRSLDGGLDQVEGEFSSFSRK